MFKNCFSDFDWVSSVNLDLSIFNTISVTDMSEMFAGCASIHYHNPDEEDDLDIMRGLISINLSSFNTSNVTNMSGMFKGCYALRNLNLSNFNTQNVTDMSYMFYNTSYIARNPFYAYSYLSGLWSINISNFNTSNVTNMSYMFGECEALSSLDLSNFITSSVTDMSGMFSDCYNIRILNLPYFDMSNVISKTSMCSNLSTCSGNYSLSRGWENNHCTITCPLSVQTAMQSGTNLPSSDLVTFTWVRPTSK